MNQQVEPEIFELARTLTLLRQLSLENEERKAEFRQKALEAVGRLNAFLRTLRIPGSYSDWYPFYSRYDDIMHKWESGYRLILEDSVIKIKEFDEWRALMYPEAEDPRISFDSLPVERLANALGRLPDFLRILVEELEQEKEKYKQLINLAEAIENAISSEIRKVSE